MKRSREVTIIINSLVENGLLHEGKTDRARGVIKHAIKKMRVEKYREKQTKNC